MLVSRPLQRKYVIEKMSCGVLIAHCRRRFVMSDNEMNKRPCVVAWGLFKKEDRESPIVKKASLRFVLAAIYIHDTLMRLHTITTRHIGRLK